MLFVYSVYFGEPFLKAFNIIAFLPIKKKKIGVPLLSAFSIIAFLPVKKST